MTDLTEEARNTFHGAIRTNNGPVLAEMFERGLSATDTNIALRVAARANRLEVLRALVKLGAEAELQFSAVLAAREGHASCVDYLLSVGATVEGEVDGHSVFSASAGNGHLELVKTLWPRAAGHASLTRKALRLAAQNGQRAVLELLLERGVPIDAADGDLSALGAAAGAGQALLVDLLVARGADVVRHGTAALLFALERSAPGAEALLAHLSAPLSPRQSRQAIALAKELGNRPLIASVKRLEVAPDSDPGPLDARGGRRDVADRGPLLDTLICRECGDVTLEVFAGNDEGSLVYQCAACGNGFAGDGD